MTSQHIKIIAAVLLFFAALLGFGAWYAARVPEPVASAEAQPGNQHHAVVVTMEALPAGVPINAGQLKLVELPIRPEGSFGQIAEVVGRAPVMSLGVGVPLIDAQLASGLATQVEEGQRAVAVNVDETIGVGNRIVPGDFVDVFFLLKRDDREIAGTQARLLLSRLRVLTYGPQSISQAAPQPQEGAAGRRAEPTRTAVLAVPVDDVNALLVAQQAGHLLLALRNPADAAEPTAGRFALPPPVLMPVAGQPVSREPLDTAAAGVALAGMAGPVATRSAALQAASMTRPAATKPAPATAGIEVIRGGKRSVE